MNRFPSAVVGRASGYALITALIFLVVLTLVATTVLRSSGLEMRMSTNSVMRNESFEASDSIRGVANDVLDVHAFNRGWPVSRGGSIPDAEFDYTIPAPFNLLPAGTPRDWYVANSEVTCPSDGLLPHALCKVAATGQSALDVDATYLRLISGAGPTSPNALSVDGNLRIFKVRTDINPGAGAAMVAGYEGTGRSLAGSGGRVLFFVQSTANDTGPGDPVARESRTDTGAVFRHVIRN